MFFDFSSAFNTIQCHFLVQELIQMNVDTRTSLWILGSMTTRPQFIRISSNAIYGTLYTSTGALQGSVLSFFVCPVHGEVYTQER